MRSTFMRFESCCFTVVGFCFWSWCLGLRRGWGEERWGVDEMMRERLCLIPFFAVFLFFSSYLTLPGRGVLYGRRWVLVSCVFV